MSQPDSRQEHQFFRRILIAFLTTILIFVVGFTLLCIGFVRYSRTIEARNADAVPRPENQRLSLERIDR